MSKARFTNPAINVVSHLHKSNPSVNKAVAVPRTKTDLKSVKTVADKKAFPQVKTVVNFVHEFSNKDHETFSGLPRTGVATDTAEFAVAMGDFKAKPGQCSVDYEMSGYRHIYVGLGPVEKCSMDSTKTAIHAALTKMKELKVDGAAFQFPYSRTLVAQPELTDSYHLSPSAKTERTPAKERRLLNTIDTATADKLVELVSQWVTQYSYKTTKYRGTKAQEEEHHIKTVDVVVDPKKLTTVGAQGTKGDLKAATKRGSIVGHAINTCKDHGDTRPDEGTPAYYAAWANQLCAKHSSGGILKMKHHLHGKQLREKGLNLHWNVGKGAEFPPHLCVMEYIGDKKSSKSTALVGKGVTFDNGGLHVKPYGAMENMHMDMLGAGTVLATMQAIAELRLPVNVCGVVGLAENAISAPSYRPSSIIRSLKGSTVEVLNTDAEGRLVLADALTFVQDHAKLVKKPDEIIDLATLTGAVLVALGSDRAAMFCNNDPMRQALYNASIQVQEPLWPLPIAPEHVKKMKGSMSDLKNVGGGREGGSATAAAFLQHFINPGMNWSHLDIAGTAMNDKMLGVQPGGASGYGVALLLKYLKNKYE